LRQGQHLLRIADGNASSAHAGGELLQAMGKGGISMRRQFTRPISDQISRNIGSGRFSGEHNAAAYG
jgi:hypothetical protein